MRSYRSTLPDAEIAYAGKAFLYRAMVRLIAEEGLSLDVCSAGEIAVARAAGFPAERLVLHGNVKIAEDLKAALAVGVGRIVVDSVEEIEALGDLAIRPQRVLIRVAPGADGHTHRAITTGVEGVENLLAEDVSLPDDVHAGDLLAVPCSGAYHHSMASNYNLVGRPPVVAVADGQADLLVRRETEEDLLRRDVG